MGVICLLPPLNESESFKKHNRLGEKIPFQHSGKRRNAWEYFRLRRQWRPAELRVIPLNKASLGKFLWEFEAFHFIIMLVIVIEIITRLVQLSERKASGVSRSQNHVQ